MLYQRMWNVVKLHSSIRATQGFGNSTVKSKHPPQRQVVSLSSPSGADRYHRGLTSLKVCLRNMWKIHSSGISYKYLVLIASFDRGKVKTGKPLEHVQLLEPLVLFSKLLSVGGKCLCSQVMQHTVVGQQVPTCLHTVITLTFTTLL